MSYQNRLPHQDRWNNQVHPALDVKTPEPMRPLKVLEHPRAEQMKAYRAIKSLVE